MPGILQAGRSSNSSSAFQLGGSTQDPWEQASRESYHSLVDGGLLPGGYGDVFVRLAQKARPAQKRRGAQAASLRAEEVRKTATEQHLIACGRVSKRARTRLAMMSFASPTVKTTPQKTRFRSVNNYK